MPSRACWVLSTFSVVGVLLLKWSLTYVVPPSLLAGRREVGSVPHCRWGSVASKCVSRAVRAAANGVLSPLQVGVGVPAGCEAIVHSVSCVLEDPSIPPDERCILLVDFSNAFNSVDWDGMFKEVRARIPSMAAWLESCYGSQPFLHDHTILSCCGVQQGDPLGPLCFALSLHPIIKRIKEEVPGLLINAWYLDDGTLCGSVRDLRAALSIIEAGLSLNRSKSLLHVPADASLTSNCLHAAIPVTCGGFDLLGSPVGSSAHCLLSVLRRIEKLQEVLAKLGDLQDSQMETSLLRSCLSLPKVAYALRTCPPGYIRQALMAFDDTMRESLADLAGGPLPDWAWLKASLPVSLGGLGIRRASLHAPAAFIGSLCQASSLVAGILGYPPGDSIHLPSAISALANAAGKPEWASIGDIDVPLRQRTLFHTIDEASHADLLSRAPDTRSKALALSSAIRQAGDWLNAVPSRALGLHLRDQEFRLCLQYWLGLTISAWGTLCPICQVAADPFGDHQAGCGGNGDRILRHDSIRDAVFSAAQSAALAPRKEVPFLIPGTLSRPADIFLPNWQRGQPAALDLTVISTLQQSTLQGAASTQGHALVVGAERKLAAHAAACRAAGITFVPLVVESLGGWSNEAADTITKIGRLQGQRLGVPPAESIRHLFNCFAVLVNLMLPSTSDANISVADSVMSIRSSLEARFHVILRPLVSERR